MICSVFLNRCALFVGNWLFVNFGGLAAARGTAGVPCRPLKVRPAAHCAGGHFGVVMKQLCEGSEIGAVKEIYKKSCSPHPSLVRIFGLGAVADPSCQFGRCLVMEAADKYRTRNFSSQCFWLEPRYCSGQSDSTFSVLPSAKNCSPPGAQRSSPTCTS